MLNLPFLLASVLAGGKGANDMVLLGNICIYAQTVANSVLGVYACVTAGRHPALVKGPENYGSSDFSVSFEQKGVNWRKWSSFFCRHAYISESIVPLLFSHILFPSVHQIFHFAPNTFKRQPRFENESDKPMFLVSRKARQLNYLVMGNRMLWHSF